ncbi:MAG: lipopolysaccharide biosynthesis protein [Lachnospiraceae bacterium]|nr:lipopolysaccharide biosynthesis protein [Lachnospiraceae bacterium]
MQEKLSVKKSILWNTAGSIFYYFCQWLMTAFVVRISGVEAAGILALCISSGNIWIAIANFGMHNYQASDTKDKYSFDTYLASRYISGAIALLSSVIYVLALSYSLEKGLCIILFFLYRFSESIEDIYYAAFQKDWRVDIAGKSMLLRGLLSIGLFTAVLIASDNLALTIFCIGIACMAAVFFYDGRLGKKYRSGRADKEEVKALLLECLPLAIYYLLNTFVPMAPRLFMDPILGSYKLGVYGSIATPTAIIQMIAIYAFNPFITLFAEEMDRGDIKGFRKSLGKCLLWLFGISAVFVAAGLVLGHWGLEILYGEEIADYDYLLTPLIIVAALMAFAWLLGGVLIAIRSFRWLIISNVVSAGCIIPATILLEQRFDMQGGSYATILAMGLAIIILLIALTEELKKRGEALQTAGSEEKDV